MYNSISLYLQEKHNTKMIVGKRGQKCVFCGKNTLSIKADDTLAKCFHETCGKFVSLSKVNSEGGVYGFLYNILSDFKNALLKQTGDNSALRYLTDVRNIHNKVIADASIGAVPGDYNLDAKYTDVLTPIQERLNNTTDEKEKEMIERHIKHLEEAKTKIANMIEHFKGWLCFFHTDEAYRIVNIRLRKPYTKDMAYCKLSNTPGLFGLELFSSSNHDEGNSLLVMESYFDLLQLQSLTCHTSEEEKHSYVDAVSTGGASGVDFETISALCQHPVICYHNDDAGIGVVANARDKMHVDAFTVPQPFNDLDDFLRSYENNYDAAWAAYSRLVDQRKTYHRYFASVALETEQVRRGKGKEFFISKLCAEIILPDLYERGCFYISDFDGYYFLQEEKKLINISKDDPDLIDLLSRYGINQSEKLFRYMFAEIGNECYTNGVSSRIHQFAYYHTANNVLYVSNNANQIFKITESKIETVDNGTDGVIFFSHRRWQPFSLVNIDDSRSLLQENIIEQINFAVDGMTLAEKQYLFEVWVYSLFFESIQPTKVIITILGEKGSGKTFSIRKVGMLFFGELFDITPLPKEQSDFDVAAANSYYLAIDNADTKVDWLEDRIATIATGGTLKVRKLYTNNELMEIDPHCFLAITARTPYFRRDDIADRLLIFKVRRIEEFIAEKELLAEVMENRNRIMTEILMKMQQILPALKSENGYSGKLRMADFASFASKVAAADGKDDSMKLILEKLAAEQSMFTLEKDPIVELLSAWLLHKNNEGRFVSNKTLHVELKNIAEELGEKFSYANHRSFAQKMTQIRTNLAQFFTIDEKNVGGHQKEFAYYYKVEIKEGEFF